MSSAKNDHAGVREGKVRDELRKFLGNSDDNNFQMINEFWIPRSHERADIAVVGPLMSGYEIKTHRDTLKRLPRQMTAYSRVFQQCHIALARRHLPAALSLLPDWWGVIVIEDREGVRFMRIRDAKINREVDSETLVRLLWREEARAVLTRLGAAPEPSMDRISMWTSLLQMVDANALCRIVAEVLLERNPAQARIPTRHFSMLAQR
jgi:hypothetical protein